MKKWLILFVCAAVGHGRSAAQTLSGAGTRWDNSYVEWELYQYVSEPDTADTEPTEEKAGELRLRWLNIRDDWTEWDYEVGDASGTIKLKWKNDPTHWELRGFNGQIITMRAAWSNDLTEWRITDDTHTLTLKSKWTNQLDEWQVKDAQMGAMDIYTVVRGDARDWAIQDELDEEISFEMRLAILFIALYHSTPRI